MARQKSARVRIVCADNSLKLRYEQFGGIVATEVPPYLAFVDRQFVREIGHGPSELWTRPVNAVLSGPIEAHYAVTNFCRAQCRGCYMDSKNDASLLAPDRCSFDRARQIAGVLADMGVFHVALGGGESFSVPWFLELAHLFRGLGIVPNVTTNGHDLTPEICGQCDVFGQVNVSLDSVDDLHAGTRSSGHFKHADAALQALRDQGIRFGINCVVSSKNYESLDKIVAYAKKIGAVDVEFLRFKPSGRGGEIYREMVLSHEQGVALVPKLKKLVGRYRMRIKLDCSFTPFVCYHKPKKHLLEFFSILGCDAGNWLIGVSPEGFSAPCSFVEDEDLEVDRLRRNWESSATFSNFRFWDRDTDSPCSNCHYLSICKGGCHAVSKYLTGSIYNPDPECPFIVRGGF